MKEENRVRRQTNAVGKSSQRKSQLSGEGNSLLPAQEAERVESELAARRNKLRAPVDLHFPFCGGEAWSDPCLFQYVTGVLRDNADAIRRDVFPQVKDKFQLIKLAECIEVCRGQPLPGLSGRIEEDESEMLFVICDALYTARDLVQKKVLPALIDTAKALELAEALAIAEAVASRGGVPTDYDEIKTGALTPLMQQAWDYKLKVLGMGDDLPDMCGAKGGEVR